MKTVNFEKNGIQISVKTNGDLSETLRNEIIEALGRSAVFCNDLTGELWCFDTKLPSGVWLENIKPNNNLQSIECLVIQQ